MATWNANIEIGIVEVGHRVAEILPLVAEYLELERLVAKTEIAKNLLTLGETITRGLVLVKQIAAQQYEIDLLDFGQLERLLERHERVGAALGIALHVAQMVVGGHQNLERVGRIVRVVEALVVSLLLLFAFVVLRQRAFRV